MDAAYFDKTFNKVLSNCDTCIEQMRLVLNSIGLSINEITRLDVQRGCIFHHAPRNKVDEQYAMDQIIIKIQTHKKNFFLTKGTFLMDRNNLINTNQVITEITKIYIIKQNRVTVTSNREKFTKRNGKRNLPRVIKSESRK